MKIEDLPEALLLELLEMAMRLDECFDDKASKPDGVRECEELAAKLHKEIYGE